ncbi:MAG: hypothetical protein U1F25_03780 [Rubrivivax sp.]
MFASLPRLGLIVVDEEHDASFKQQEGARCTGARPRRMARPQLRVPVLLGSATPSLETWQRVQEGRYRRLVLPERVGGGELPRVRLVDMRSLAMRPAAAPPPSASSVGAATPTPLSPPLLAALNERIARGEQSLRAPAAAAMRRCSIALPAAGRAAAHCSAWRVFHKIDRTLRCHHCGFAERVPRACPECGNLDITPLGRGTEKLEEQARCGAPPGARITRIDADSTRRVGELARQLGAVHEVRSTCLWARRSSPRARLPPGHAGGRGGPRRCAVQRRLPRPERLFALLMQAAGRAAASRPGRAQQDVDPDFRPLTRLYAALARHDYEAFAAQLDERRAAGRRSAPPRVVPKRAAPKRPPPSCATRRRRYARSTPPLAWWPTRRCRRRWRWPTSSARRCLSSRARAGAATRAGRLAARAERAARAGKGVIRWAVDVDPLAI